ncbi:MAG: autotransporter domain-containing protein [Xanthobacteraceae bacterium]|nr:autotransporter domain-containing protein [Xanthobacteraceae bacterium]
MGVWGKSRQGFAGKAFAFGLAGFGLIVGGQGAAFASAGCTALNGTYNGGVVTGSTSGTGFSAGDVVTLTVNVPGAMSALGLSSSAPAVLLADTMNPGSRTYPVPANTTATFTITGFTIPDAGASYAWSCVSAAGSGGTASEKLTSVQTTGSTVAANTSGAAISGSVSDATNAALSSSGSGESTNPPVYMTADEFAVNWVHQRHPGARGIVYDVLRKQGLNYYKQETAKGNAFIARPGSWPGFIAVAAPASQFAPEQQSAVVRRADEAFAALASLNKAPRATHVFTPQWSTWGDVRGSGFEQNDASALKGTQINATGGVTYKARANLVVGVFAGYENFKYDFASLTGSLKGNGGSIGTYAGWAITPTLRWTGMVGWTGVSYDASAATASGSFSGSRWLFSTGLTGRYLVSLYTLEPSATVFAVTERQTAYTDNLGAAHDARSFTTGRVSVGGRVLAPPQAFAFTPYVGFYGDWRFASDSTQVAAVPFTGIGDGWSARATGGFSMQVLRTGSLSLGGEYGGIGANYKLWTGNARLTVPF